MSGFVVGASAAASSSAATVTAAEAGFLAGVMGFIAGWAVIILAVIILFGILSEHNDSSGWAVFWLMVAGAIAYFAFSFSITTLLIAAVAYIPIGLFWSFWRYKRYVSKKVAEAKDSSSHERERVLRMIHPKEMIGKITAWVFVWPFSLVANLTGDLINFVSTLISKFFRGVYMRIYDSAVSQLK